MSYEPTRTEVARLLALLGRGGSAPQKELKPAWSPAERKALEGAGFLRVTKGARNALQLELTDRAWDWAGGHLDAPSSLTGAAGLILKDWMGHLVRYMAASGVSLAEILSPRAAKVPADLPAPPPALSFEAVRAAAVALGGGQTNVRVRLKALRRALPQVAPADLDALLRAAAGRGDIALYHLDDPRDRDSEDEAASIDLGGRPAHILYVR